MKLFSDNSTHHHNFFASFWQELLMFRMMIACAVSTLTLVGCVTPPSDVYIAERRITTEGSTADASSTPETTAEPGVVFEGRFYYTDPITAVGTEGQLLWNYELARALKKVRDAKNDEDHQFAREGLAIIQAAKPSAPPRVFGIIANVSEGRDFTCVVYSDQSKGLRLGTVLLPPRRPETSFVVPQGTHPHFVYFEDGVYVGERTMENPAHEGWLATIK